MREKQVNHFYFYLLWIHRDQGVPHDSLQNKDTIKKMSNNWREDILD